MAAYRFSEDAIDRILGKAQRQWMALMALMLLTPFAIDAFSHGLRQSWPSLVIIPVLGPFLFWQQRRSAGKTRSGIQSTTIEIDDEELKGGNSLVTTTIRREDVVELRYLRDGIMVRGRGLRQTLLLTSELDQFDDLARRLQEWAPAEAVRIHSSSSMSYWIIGLIVANMGLLAVALAAKSPTIAIPCCMAEAAILAACIVWVRRSEGVAPRLRRQMLFCALPVVSMAAKAYVLWNQG